MGAVNSLGRKSCKLVSPYEDSSQGGGVLGAIDLLPCGEGQTISSLFFGTTTKYGETGGRKQRKGCLNNFANSLSGKGASRSNSEYEVGRGERGRKTAGKATDGLTHVKENTVETTLTHVLRKKQITTKFLREIWFPFPLSAARKFFKPADFETLRHPDRAKLYDSFRETK